MTEKRKIPRLGKAAVEFNVSMQTVVDFLNKKGFAVDANPNAKLAEEMYDLLVKEFHKEKEAKEKFQKIDIGGGHKKGEEHNKKKEVEKETIKIAKKEVEGTKKIEKEVEVIRPETPSIKITGYIKLDENNRPIKESIPEEETAIASTESVDNRDIQVEEEKLDLPLGSSEQEVVESEQNGEDEDVSIVEEEQTNKESIDEEKYSESKEEVDNEIEAVVESTEESLDNGENENRESVSADEVAQDLTSEEKSANNYISTEYIKITPPKVIGKIDLDSNKPKATSKKEKEVVKPTNSSTNSNSGNEDKKKRKRTRVKHPVKPSGETNKPKAPVAPKVEISKEDIDRQIKETTMRLGPLGKSKTSKRKREKRQHIQEEMRETLAQQQEEQKKLKVTEFITANELATLMNLQVTTIIATCMNVGLAVSINQRLDAETISLLADEFGFEVEFVKADIEEELSINVDDNEEDLEPRHPIITVMGHVDHGKTSLLDYIRKSNVIAGEAGGITQHIGAYEVVMQDGRKITFLDTPGHEAFTAMRARGAKVTDVCIIVIAADDAVMPQTIEAINHAQAAGVAMVFAITKIDKPTAAPDKIREELAAMNILVEEWGGKYQCQEIDAKHGVNVDELLEKVLLEAEMLELKANPKKNGVGTVLESSLDKGKGYVAKVLVQNGTIKVGDPILAGTHYGKVKALYNERNQQVKSAGPATPILLLGLSGAPQAGDIINVCHSDHEARVAATKRAQLVREMGLRTQKHITLDEIGRRIAIGDFKELNIIVKGDVDGSVEALSDALLKLSTPQVQVNVIHKSVGQVTESDVLLASASNAVIVAFQVRPSAVSRKLAEQEQIDIRTYSVIYDATSEIKDAIAGMHSPEIREKVICNIEIREVYKISKVGKVAGCMVLDGKLQRNTQVRVIRDGIVVYSGKLGSLRRFKDDVKEVVAGQDCGLNIEKFDDIKVGDIVEGYEVYEVKSTY